MKTLYFSNSQRYGEDEDGLIEDDSDDDTEESPRNRNRYRFRIYQGKYSLRKFLALGNITSYLRFHSGAQSKHGIV